MEVNRKKGIICIIASAFGFAAMAACVRLCDDFGGPISSFQKSFFRNLIALAIAASVFVRQRGQANAELRYPKLREIPVALWLRVTLGTIGIFANFYALSHIPIAEGQTLNKTAPFFTVLFVALFMGERISRRQLSALIVAFIGTLLVTRPGFAGEQTFPLAMGLLGGVCAGGAYACVRYLAAEKIAPAYIVLFFSVFSCLASVPFMLAHFDPTTFAQLLTLLGAGAGAAMGQFGITLAYRYAPPASISVFDYTNILFTAMFGLLLFGQLPNVVSILGMILIVSAALISFRNGK